VTACYSRAVTPFLFIEYTVNFILSACQRHSGNYSLKLQDLSNRCILVRRRGNHYGSRSLRKNLSCDPLKGPGQPLLQPDGGFPTQDFTQTSIVAVPTTYALRSTQVVSLPDLFASDPSHQVDQFINRYEFIGSQN